MEVETLHYDKTYDKRQKWGPQNDTSFPKEPEFSKEKWYLFKKWPEKNPDRLFPDIKWY